MKQETMQFRLKLYLILKPITFFKKNYGHSLEIKKNAQQSNKQREQLSEIVRNEQ